MTPSDDNLADALRDAAEQAARAAREHQADRPARAGAPSGHRDDEGGKEARDRGDADEDTAHVSRRRRPRVDHDD